MHGLKSQEKAEQALPQREKESKERVAQGWLSISDRSRKMADRSKPWKENQASN